VAVDGELGGATALAVVATAENPSATLRVQTTAQRITGATLLILRVVRSVRSFVRSFARSPTGKWGFRESFIADLRSHGFIAVAVTHYFSCTVFWPFIPVTWPSRHCCIHRKGDFHLSYKVEKKTESFTLIFTTAIIPVVGLLMLKQESTVRLPDAELHLASCSLAVNTT
jgi:hypothetical protein